MTMRYINPRFIIIIIIIIIIHPNMVMVSQTVAELCRFNGFQNGSRLPSWGVFDYRIRIRIHTAYCATHMRDLYANGCLTV